MTKFYLYILLTSLFFKQVFCMQAPSLVSSSPSSPRAIVHDESWLNSILGPPPSQFQQETPKPVSTSAHQEPQVFFLKKTKTNNISVITYQCRPITDEEKKLLVIPSPEEIMATHLRCACFKFEGTRAEIYAHIKECHRYVPSRYDTSSTNTNSRKPLYSCPYRHQKMRCTKKFNDIKSITDHMIKHTKDRPFPCPIPGCYYGAGLVIHLSAHFDRHENLKPFQCGSCQRSFRHNYELHKHHLKSHRLCLACNNSFDPEQAKVHAKLKPSCLQQQIRKQKTKNIHRLQK